MQKSLLTIFAASLSLASSARGVDPGETAALADTRAKRSSKWEKFGSRKIRVSYERKYDSLFLLIHIPRVDKVESFWYNKFKVTAEDPDGKPIQVTRHYTNQSAFQDLGHAHLGFYKLGTFVQQIPPDQVAAVTVEYGKQKVRLPLFAGDPDATEGTP